ncbi:UDP-4-amino-4,6-dideoxy-N-acetyl-beta-L-altrosamine transaminase [Chitiniphilus purpureus]|uniref:UDP-4-amino-4, 6-dideoxy-N-acetyl-beta-L-altrosamine transaminase n=1 Tax=Chitiniphilus purpureus TaxID=2981137 RepID=A0ABY6DMF7_9NEIS|nr:UDP-4-amino-4,6-dideoxy-N-acetyl-beta-L-altrosamine transaminase [Chitiniphilus sp. CD1]UXY15555.1 UDP-4-amino-4,6-dideoxy-N-acetyl-beta-L-altrosamine transaminase [Chitiniphilus sp. CD1]
MAIPYGRQWLDEDDERAVLDTLRSDYLTQGPKIAEFEQALCDYTGARHCVVVASGTAALHLAVAALALPAGSEGITSANTFTASANSMAYCGIKPVFADIDPISYNIDPASIAARITPATRLLTPVHFAGQPAEMTAIAALAREHGLKVIEDAAHAIGSRYRDGSPVGNCRHSDATIFSFHPVKTLTTGEGGAVMTNDEALYRRMLLLRSHGITKDPALLTQNPGPWYYEMHGLGWHYRMTDMQAALGLSQLKKLDRFAARRRGIVARYNRLLAGLPWLRTPVEADGVTSCFHLYVPCIDFAALGLTRAEAMQRLLAQGIGSQVHYIPVHTQPWYRETYGYGPGDCPVAEAYYAQCLSLPLYPALTDDEVATVAAAVRSLG